MNAFKAKAIPTTTLYNFYEVAPRATFFYALTMYLLLRRLLGAALLLFPLLLEAQSSFWIKGQVRPRFEFRQGFKALRPTDAPPAALVEQRTRLTLGYQHNGITFFLQPQDIRVWGSTPLVNNSNGFFTLFQGWAKLRAGKKFTCRCLNTRRNAHFFPAHGFPLCLVRHGRHAG